MKRPKIIPKTPGRAWIQKYEIPRACASRGKKQYAVPLETLTLKKSSNTQVFDAELFFT